MSAELLVRQLRFTRSEFMRCLAGISPEDAARRVQPMNCISWMVGHLATQEQYFWVIGAQHKILFPNLYDLVGTGRPASTPSYSEMLTAWREITASADSFLDGLTDEMLTTFFELDGRPVPENIGTLLLRNIYHYWFHTGEAHAVRQQLGHTDLPQFVGDISPAAVR
jgi:uncharacterized damage-inducible protein DinB